MIGIYRITSPSGRIYIGQSIRLEERIYEYKKNKNCDRQRKLFNSFKKYGVEKHIFEIIEECSIENLNNRERYWQEHYNTLVKGLNCILTKSTDKRAVFSECVREKMSISRKGKKQSKEHISKRVNSKKGYKHSLETKNKMSEKRNRLIIDLSTGIFYDNCLEASKALCIKKPTLRAMLVGRLKNKTNLIFA